MRTIRIGPLKAVLAGLLFATSSWGANALIVQDGTSGDEAAALANLTAKLTSASYTVTPVIGDPGSLAGYQQVWDIRYQTPMSGPLITQYVQYMAGGGSLFVMGENAGFVSRDNTIVTLISSAGGGNISLQTPLNAETVLAPFTGPTSLSNLTFLAAYGTGNPARGAFITQDSNQIGAAIVYSPGRMTQAVNGTLIVIFDVNFLETGADANSQIFIGNLISYLGAPTPDGPPLPPTPAPSSLLLMLTGGCGVAGFELYRRTRAARQAL